MRSKQARLKLVAVAVLFVACRGDVGGQSPKASITAQA